MLRHKVLNWLADVSQRTIRDVEEADIPGAFEDPLRHLAILETMNGEVRRAAEDSLERLDRGEWRPRFVLHIREALDWFAFGMKTSAHKILFQLYTNADYQVVGYYFGSVANGYYRLAYDVVLDVFPELIAWGVLVVPKDIEPGEKRPVVVCQHGRNGVPRDTIDGD